MPARLPLRCGEPSVGLRRGAAFLRRRRVEYRGRPRDIFEFLHDGKNIWGVTAAILLSLVRRMEAVT